MTARLLKNGDGRTAFAYRESLAALSPDLAFESPIVGLGDLIAGADLMDDEQMGERVLTTMLDCPLLNDPRQRADVVLRLADRYIETDRCRETVALVESANLDLPSAFFRLARHLLVRGLLDEAEAVIARLHPGDRMHVRRYAYVSLEDHGSEIAERLLDSITDDGCRRRAMTAAAVKDTKRTGRLSPLHRRVLAERLSNKYRADNQKR